MLLAILDIETTSKLPHTKIGAIGVSIIDTDKFGEYLPEFYERVNLFCPHNVTRIEDLATLTWWGEQRTKHPEAFKEVFDKSLKRLSLQDTLIALSEFLIETFGSTKNVRIVGNGPEFDCSILVNAFEHVGIEVPWTFFKQDSVRTFVTMYEIKYGIRITHEIPFTGVKHHALHDARWEAEVCAAVIRDYLLTNHIPLELTCPP